MPQLTVHLLKGSFRQAAFSARSCVTKLQCCGKLENFLSLWKRNCLLQLHSSNTRHVNQP